MPLAVRFELAFCDDENRSVKMINNYNDKQSVRHCKWADEVAPDAPWYIDDAFIVSGMLDHDIHAM
jgi:choline-phosphate cytidylyltransferase